MLATRIKVFSAAVGVMAVNWIYADTFTLGNVSGSYDNTATWLEGIIPPIDGTAQITFQDGAASNCNYNFNLKDENNLISFSSIEDTVTDNKIRDIYISTNTTFKATDIILNVSSPLIGSPSNLRFRKVSIAEGTNFEVDNLRIYSGSVEFGHSTSAGQRPTSVSVGALTFYNSDKTTSQIAKFYGETNTVGRIVNASSSTKIKLEGDFVINGDFFQRSNLSLGADTSIITISNTNNSLTMTGLLRMSGDYLYNALRFAGVSSDINVTVSTAGIIGGTYNGSSSVAIRLTSGITGSGADIVITGNGEKNVYGGRIHDLNQGTDPTSEGGKLSITMDATDPNSVQYLAGNTYIRGLTTIKNGSLFVYGNDDSLRPDDCGLRDVILEGGVFGACGKVENNKVNEIGNIYMNSLTWSGGSLSFDIDGDNFDQLIIAGDFYKGGTLDSFEIKFNLSNIKAENGVSDLYKIIDLSDYSYSNFTEDDFAAIGLPEGVTADFVMRERDGLYVSFSGIIPEPAEYAAIFGIFALLIAAIRKRRLGA